MKSKKLIAVITAFTVGMMVFAQSAEYTTLLKKAKDYEAKKQYASALGTYYDAVAAEPTENSKEAYEAFIKLENVIKGGKPGFGDFDEFSIYDDWVLLLKDCERYFTENPAHAVLIGEPKKGDIDRTTRTATYTVTVMSGFSEKAVRILNDLQSGMKKSRKKDWTDISEDWPFVSVYANSFKEGTYLKDGVALFYQNGDDIKISGTKDVMGGKRVVAAAFANSAWILSDSDVDVAAATKRLTDTDRYMTRNERMSYEMQQNILGQLAAVAAQTMQNFSLYDITLAIVDENGKELVKGARLLLDSNKKEYAFTGVSQDVMKQIDSGKAKIVPTGLFLEYGKPAKNGITKDRTWLKSLPEIKFDVKQAIWNSADDVDVIAKAEKADAEAKAAAEKAVEEAKAYAETLAKISPEPADYASILDDYKELKIAKYEVTQYLFLKLMGYNPSENNNALYPVNNVSFYDIMAFCNRLSIAAGLTPVYTIKKSTNPDDWGAVPTAKDKNWEKYKINSKANGYCLQLADTSGSSEIHEVVKDAPQYGKITYAEAYKKPYSGGSSFNAWERQSVYTFRVQLNKIITAKDKVKTFWDSL